MHLLWACRLPAFTLRTRGTHPTVLMAVCDSLPFQDSNPFASLVFYWEPLSRQVSGHSQDGLGWAALGGA